MKELAKDQVRKGVVKNITDFGAFIDLGGVDGLLHITDMSWGRISHPSEMVQIGMELEIKVLDIDWERERISLGLKQLQNYPWKDVARSTRSVRASTARSSRSPTTARSSSSSRASKASCTSAR
jgi:small subunit ribosomal protein S1